MEARGIVGLLDTDVLIDVQRARPEAAAWLASYAGPLALPAAVALELLMGARNKVELEANERFLNAFDVENFESADTSLARRLVASHRLTTGLGLGDFLIAAQAIHRGAILFTFNLKHFHAIPGLDARIPYAR